MMGKASGYYFLILKSIFQTFSVYDFVNPIKSETFVTIAEELSEYSKELRNNSEPTKADFVDAFVWYFREHKSINCSCDD